MTIKKINVILKIKMESNEIAEMFRKVMDPDNLARPPMKFFSHCISSNLIYTIKNVERVETMLATLLDLLSVLQATENSIGVYNC
ncbi:MAG: hypothetical protein JSV04_11935 [Candidatus Heimdallarchaeota archaeon]|nr:MAG: hypothetical protein JSV04_11935 [Candidatus Heimdallarchaeota archaeon]